jgi:Polysulphide reductase, NrfD
VSEGSGSVIGAGDGQGRGRRARWSMRELVSDEGARDRLAQVWDRGRSAMGRRPGGRGDDGSREQLMVPRATFTSYYGRPVLKPPAWKDDIAYYLFLGGLAAGSSGLAAGADLSGRPALRRGGRIGALAALGAGMYFLIHDLGRPERFHHMLRVAKPTSPMSVGTWTLTGYGAFMALAAADELLPGPLRAGPVGRLVGALARPAGLAAAVIAPAVASYTSVLLSQTAVPAWHEAHEELPFIFTASAAASAGGLGMIVAPVSEAAPARRLATYGALVELAASRRLETRLGLLAEPYLTGEPHRYLQRASTLTALGTLGGMMFGRRSRVAAILSGAALLAGSLYERLGILHAGIASTKDPKYVVQPQRERLERRRAEADAASAGPSGAKLATDSSSEA